MNIAEFVDWMEDNNIKAITGINYKKYSREDLDKIKTSLENCIKEIGE